MTGLAPATAANGVAQETVTGSSGGPITIQAQASPAGPTDGTTSFTVLAKNGSGTLTTGTGRVPHGSAHRTVVFTYTAAAGGMMGGSISVTVPAGWSAPSTNHSARGFTTSSLGTVSVSGRTIVVSGVTRSAGQVVTITYGSKAFGGPGATAPSTAVGSQTWQSAQRSTAGSSRTSLASSPKIKVV